MNRLPWQLWTRLKQEDGQAASEYFVLLGLITLLVIAAMGVLVSPIAFGVVWLAKRIVFDLSS